jgi:pyridoxamine 5'-phosphate oxidase
LIGLKVVNYQNAGLVSSKQLIDIAFVITGPINSRKKVELENNESIVLPLW